MSPGRDWLVVIGVIGEKSLTLKKLTLLVIEHFKGFIIYRCYIISSHPRSARSIQRTKRKKRSKCSWADIISTKQKRKKERREKDVHLQNFRI